MTLVSPCMEGSLTKAVCNNNYFFVVTIRNLLLSQIKICSKRAVSDTR